LMTSLQ